MLNITNHEFSTNKWNQMVLDTVNSRKNNEEHKYVCRVIYPNNKCTLELKTDGQIKDHFQKYGSWNSNCGKMQLRDLLNITRISNLNNPVKSDIKESLDFIASRAETKYNNGFKGAVKKLTSIFFNLFTTDSVELFCMLKTNVSLEVVGKKNKHKLPLFIGHNANFAHLIKAS